MPRPHSVAALFRRLVVLRWKKASLNTRLAIVAGAVLIVAAVVSSVLAACPARSSCCARQQAAAAPAPAPHPVSDDAVGEPCPFSTQQ